ncbi:MAG: M50 family metallopeptidase [Bacteroidota bacterium]
MAKKKKTASWLLFALGLPFGAAVGYMIGSFFKNEEATQAVADKPSLWVLIPILMLAFFVVIFIHELGHVIGGLIMGNEFGFMIVGPFKLQKEEGKYSLTWNKSAEMAGGLALTLPTSTENFKKRRAVVIGSGPFASLLLAIACGSLWYFSVFEHFSNLNLANTTTGAMSAAIFLATMIPSKLGGFMSDGMQLLMTLRNDDKAKKYANFMHLFALNNQGVAPKDYPLELFDGQMDQPIEDLHDFAFQQYLYYRDLDQKAYESAQTRISQMEQQVDLYPASYHHEVIAEWVIFYGLIQPNPTEVARLLAEMDGKKPSMSKVTIYAFEAAMAKNEGDLSKATEFAQKLLTLKKSDGTTKMYKNLVQNFSPM